MVITLLPPANVVNGKTREDFVKIYWQALCPIPKSDNPAWQNDGSKDRSFNNSINEDLYMLSFSRDPQTQVYRRIDDFPRNKGLFIPLMSVIVSRCETTQNLTSVASLDQTSIDIPTLALELDLNLHTLGEINRYIINAGQIKEFDVQFPKNQSDVIFPIPAGSGPCEAIAAGRYIWTEPLDPGTHYVYFRGNLRCPQLGPPPPVSCIDSFYHEDIIYRIHVP